jgi:hypothetical protein
MTEREQFIAFVESLRTEENGKTIGAILEGYGACMEAGLLNKIGKAAMPYAAAAGIIGAGAASGVFDDSELVKYQQEEYEKSAYETPQLSNMIRLHELAIENGDKDARASAYDALKAANVRVIYDPSTNFKFYHDDNRGRDFHINGKEITGYEQMDLPSL